MFATGFEVRGEPITVQLVSGLDARLGKQVHAGSNIRRREMLLERELLRNRGELARILVHELLHFVWARLGNARRAAWERLLDAEISAGARGELGWSAEVRKKQLTAADRLTRSRRWREYVCESFCDTGAWLYAGLREHEEWTLAKLRRGKRAACLVPIIERDDLCV